VARLSELEGAVLGMLWSDGPLTAYAVRSRFLKSRSSHFSGSAGAIYPLVERLANAELVTGTVTRRGKRSSTLYEITAAGRKALRTWLAPAEDWMAAVEFDPLRMRVHFLGVLPAAQRSRFVREAEAHLKVEIEATERLIAELEKERDVWKAWAARGALAVLTARHQWILDLRKRGP
jgi:DNA-binding PadR family transcriptional regulator